MIHGHDFVKDLDGQVTWYPCSTIRAIKKELR